MNFQGIVLTLSIAMLVVACSNDSQPTDTSSSGGGKMDVGIATVVDANHGYLAYYMKTDGFVFDTVAGVQRKFTLTPQYYTTAIVYPKPDTVRLGSTLLPNSASTNTFYTGASSFTFGGSSYTWHKIDGGDPYTITMNSPLSDVSISSPTNGDSISKSSNLVVSWTAASDTCLVYLVIAPEDKAGSTIEVETTDAGSYTFTTSALSVLGTGRHSITIRRGKLKQGTSPGGKKYAAAIFGQHTVDVDVIN